MRKSVSNLVGKTSFLAAMSALVIPWIFHIPPPSVRAEGFLFFLFLLYNCLLFYVLATIGFLTGIVSWKSRIGKVGFFIAAISLGVMVGWWLICFVSFFFFPT